MASFSIVARRFSVPEFADYAAHVPLEGWRPDLVVLHNTAVPTLGDRPNGLSLANVEDLRHYYAEVRGWSGGPHLFVDQAGIWVFNPLDRHGVHSPSWNARSWGVEMLGDFATERFDEGDGLRVRTNAMAALAALFRRLGLDPTDEHFNLHKEDPRTTHDCPGGRVDKASVQNAIRGRLATAPAASTATKVVVYRKGGGQSPAAVLDATLRDGTAFSDARALARATGLPTNESGDIAIRAFVEARFSIVWKAETHRVVLAER